MNASSVTSHIRHLGLLKSSKSYRIASTVLARTSTNHCLTAAITERLESACRWPSKRNNLHGQMQSEQELVSLRTLRLSGKSVHEQISVIISPARAKFSLEGSRRRSIHVVFFQIPGRLYLSISTCKPPPFLRKARIFLNSQSRIIQEA